MPQRKKPMGRGKPRQAAEVIRVRPVLGKLQRVPNYSGSTSGAELVKPPKAKPGKRPPTKEEARWMDAITAIGCIVCLLAGHPGTPGAVHHLLRAGRRIGHMHTICLCDPGHHQGGDQVQKISRHPNKARFEAAYGTEAELLEASLQLVALRAA
jgi:hypothetical protein